MAFAADPRILADALQKAAGIGDCQVVLIREVTDVVLVYPHLWSGWSWGRVAKWALKPVYSEHFADDDYYGSMDEPDVVGFRLARRPLDELLRPTKRVIRWEEAGPSKKTVGRRKGPGTVVFDEVSFGKGLPAGRYIGCRLKGVSGVELGVMKFQAPILLKAGETLHTTSMGIEIS